MMTVFFTIKVLSWLVLLNYFSLFVDDVPIDSRAVGV